MSEDECAALDMLYKLTCKISVDQFLLETAAIGLLRNDKSVTTYLYPSEQMRSIIDTAQLKFFCSVAKRVRVRVVEMLSTYRLIRIRLSKR